MSTPCDASVRVFGHTVMSTASVS